MCIRDRGLATYVYSQLPADLGVLDGALRESATDNSVYAVSYTHLDVYKRQKKYYPAQWVGVPSAYIGFVGRLTYDYKSRYMAEVNFGYKA